MTTSTEEKEYFDPVYKEPNLWLGFAVWMSVWFLTLVFCYHNGVLEGEKKIPGMQGLQESYIRGYTDAWEKAPVELKKADKNAN